MVELRLTEVVLEHSGGHAYLRGRGAVPGVGDDDVLVYFPNPEEEQRFEIMFRKQVVIVRAQSFERIPGMGTMIKRLDSWWFEETAPTRVVSPRATDAWKKFSESEYREVWDRFYDAFAFAPSVYSEDWPSFREPTPSLTWDLEPLFEAINGEVWTSTKIAEYNSALLRSLQCHVARGERVLALDWQHDSYFFYPHRWSFDDPPVTWEVPSIPSGEYHIFVADDFRFGSLGHPWEGTLCVFGKGFLETYVSEAPKGFGRIVRRNGTAVRDSSSPTAIW